MLGVSALFLTTGESVSYQADEIFPTASTIKAVIIAELLAQRAEKRLPVEHFETASIPVEESDLVGGSGVLANLSTPQLKLSLSDLALLAIKVSDNTASNLCLRAVGGPEIVNRRMREEWMMRNTVIHRPIRFQLRESDPPHTATSTPADMCQFLAQVARRSLHSPEISESVERLMMTVTDSEMLPRFLDFNPYSTGSPLSDIPFSVAHKPGAVSGVRNDVGIIRRGKDAMALAIMTKNCSDGVWTPANRGVEAVARTAKLLYRTYFTGEAQR